MKSIQLIITMVLSVSFGLCSSQTDYSVLTGFWGKTIEDGSGVQNFVAHFYTEGDEIQCEFHSYQGGMKFGAEPAADISFDGKFLSMIVNQNANVKYEGKLDSLQNIISGKLIYSDGSEMVFNLTRYSREKIASEFPGLLYLQNSNYTYSKPEYLNDGWPISTLKEMNINETLLDEMISKIKTGEYGKVNSVLIAKKGSLVFDEYFDGFWKNDSHMLRSTTKSITSLLIGIAIDKQLINSVDQKLLDFYPEYKNELPDNWDKIQLKHVLTMTMGLSWDNQFHDNIWNESDDVIKSTFNQKLSDIPGDKFEYRNPNVDLLAGVLIKATGVSVQKFAEDNLFQPLGITSYRWKNFKKNNYPLMDGSLCLRPRDMAKIGQMILDKGKWKNNQIISSRWIEESTSAKINADEFTKYGYLWWIGESRTKPGIRAIFSNGLGGQHIVVVPELSLVIVTTGENFDKPASFLLRMIDEFIINSVN